MNPQIAAVMIDSNEATETEIKLCQNVKFFMFRVCSQASKLQWSSMRPGTARARVLALLWPRPQGCNYLQFNHHYFQIVLDKSTEQEYLARHGDKGNRSLFMVTVC